MNAIEIRDLSKSYKDFNLEHLNLTLPGGCIMGLVVRMAQERVRLSS